jgi:hypothetical protein
MDEETNTRNEIKEYLDTRYICLFDSCWRIFRFHIHRHFPLVERMPVHLPNENYVTDNAQADITHIASQEFLHRTMSGFLQIRDMKRQEIFAIVTSHPNGVGMIA